MNAAWREYSGFATGGDVRTPWTSLLCPEDRSLAVSQFSPENSTDGGTAFQCRLIDASGADRWFLLNLNRLAAVAAERLLWICVATDIDVFKKNELTLRNRAAVQEDMLDISVDCIKLIALDGRLKHMNKAGCRALGVAEGSSFGMPWLPLLPQDVWEVGEKALAEVRAGRFARFAGQSRLPGKKVQHWDNMLTPVMNPAGEPTAILCVSREVTAEREALESLKDSQERLAIATRVGGLGIWDYDILNDEMNCDDAWRQIMGVGPARPVRSIEEFRRLIHPDDVNRATEVERTAAQLIAEKRDYSIVFRIIRPDGEVRWIRSAACLMQDGAGKAVRAVGFIVDVTDAWRGELALRDANRALEEEKNSLTRQSLEDPLTGIPNRRHLDNELDRICLGVDETSGPICIGMVDIDFFKSYNDRYGHPEGDVSLRKIALALQSSVRQSDIVARYGGEEFAFVLTGLNDPLPLLTRFAAAVADLAIVHQDSPTGYLTISCGCVVLQPDKALSPLLMLKAGDKALYEAKLKGRNRLVVHSRRAERMAFQPA